MERGGGGGGEEAGYETSLTEPVVLTFPISPPICRDSWPLEQYCDDHKTRGDAGVRSHFTPWRWERPSRESRRTPALWVAVSWTMGQPSRLCRRASWWWLGFGRYKGQSGLRLGLVAACLRWPEKEGTEEEEEKEKERKKKEMTPPQAHWIYSSARGPVKLGVSIDVGRLAGRLRRCWGEWFLDFLWQGRFCLVGWKVWVMFLRDKQWSFRPLPLVSRQGLLACPQSTANNKHTRRTNDRPPTRNKQNEAQQQPANPKANHDEVCFMWLHSVI